MRLEAALAWFEMDNRRFPTTEEGLEALAAGGYLKGGAVLQDDWGNAFHYRQPGVHNVEGFDLWSLGADGQPGGECANSDVGNWPGAGPDPCLTWKNVLDLLLPIGAVGIGVALLLALPFYLVRSARRAVRAKSWRPFVKVLPALVLWLLLVGWLWLGMVQARV